MANHQVTVGNLPAWLDLEQFLGPGDWSVDPAHGGRVQAHARLERAHAAELLIRLRHVPLAGRYLTIEARPSIPRAVLRRARTADLKGRRDTTPGFRRPGTRLDTEGRFSLTPETLALRIGQLARGRSVIDAGCGAGGNAIGFARAGCRVTAIERNERRLRLARHNATVYGVEDRITFLHGEVATHLPTLRAALLFVDPPWGVDWAARQPTLDDLPPLALCLAQRGRFDGVWAKLPPSFDPDQLPDRPADNGRFQAFFGDSPGDARYIKFLLATL